MDRPLLRDLAFAAVVGAAFGASPNSGSARLGVSLAGGCLVGAAVFAWQRRRPGDAGTPVPTFAVPGSPLALAAAGLALALLFAPTLAWLFASYSDSIWRNAHGFFVPVVMGLLARARLRRGPAGDEASSLWGFAFVAAGAGLAALDGAIGSSYLAALGLVVCLPGLSLLWLGAERTRRLAFPLALGLFLVPLPKGMQDPLYLPTLMAAGVEQILGWIGIPAVREGSLFSVHQGRVGVTEGCSGLATLHAAYLLAIVVAVHCGQAWRRVAALVAPVLALLVFNTLRGVALFLLIDRYGMPILDTPIHGISGILTLWAVLASVLVFADWPRLREAFS